MWGTLSAITTTTTPQAAHNGAIDDIKDAANETYVSYLPGRLLYTLTFLSMSAFPGKREPLPTRHM